MCKGRFTRSIFIVRYRTIFIVRQSFDCRTISFDSRTTVVRYRIQTSDIYRTINIVRYRTTVVRYRTIVVRYRTTVVRLSYDIVRHSKNVSYDIYRTISYDIERQSYVCRTIAIETQSNYCTIIFERYRTIFVGMRKDIVRQSYD